MFTTIVQYGGLTSNISQKQNSNQNCARLIPLIISVNTICSKLKWRDWFGAQMKPKNINQKKEVYNMSMSESTHTNSQSLELQVNPRFQWQGPTTLVKQKNCAVASLFIATKKNPDTSP